MDYAVKISELKLCSIQRYHGSKVTFLIYFPRKWQFLPFLLIQQILLHIKLISCCKVKLVAKEFHRFYLLPILRTFSSIIANSRAPKMLVDLKMQYLSLNFSRYKNTWFFGGIRYRKLPIPYLHNLISISKELQSGLCNFLQFLMHYFFI